ncbi:MAG TPA: sigma-70 family RNA polymerase sigma factor [Cyclobacteriaceae bacterium]|nr:sigma-70 family RNA polymerase sigma factor [Cyclobacteriaceae bacterium]
MNQAQAIQLYQPLLQQIAYRLLKCKADAEDIVQDTFMKWLHIDHQKIENTKAYLITAVTNNSLNHLKTLKRKKEEYWDHLQLAGWKKKFKEFDLSQFDLELELKQAFELLTQKLEPVERAVFILREVFEIDYPAIQQIIDKKADHVRQLFSRARKKLSSDTTIPKLPAKPEESLLESFKRACKEGPNLSFLNDLKSDLLKAIH